MLVVVKVYGRASNTAGEMRFQVGLQPNFSQDELGVRTQKYSENSSFLTLTSAFKMEAS